MHNETCRIYRTSSRYLIADPRSRKPFPVEIVRHDFSLACSRELQTMISNSCKKDPHQRRASFRHTASTLRDKSSSDILNITSEGVVEFVPSAKTVTDPSVILRMGHFSLFRSRCHLKIDTQCNLARQRVRPIKIIFHLSILTK